jgi:hypothetical protein
MQLTYLTIIDRALCSNVILSSLPYLSDVSTFCKYLRCLGDNLYLDSSSYKQLFYTELPTFYYMTVVRHVNCVYVKVTNLVVCYIIWYWFPNYHPWWTETYRNTQRDVILLMYMDGHYENCRLNAVKGKGHPVTHHAGTEGAEVQLHSFLTPALDRRTVVNNRPRSL